MWRVSHAKQSQTEMLQGRVIWLKFSLNAKIPVTTTVTQKKYIDHLRSYSLPVCSFLTVFTVYGKEKNPTAEPSACILLVGRRNYFF